MGDELAKIILLGSGAALSDASRENMYLVVQGKQSSILIDCAGSPIQRLLKARVPLDSIDHVILTHHHPDHVYGLPIFLMGLWLAGRKKVLHVYGLAETLHAARAMMDAFEWQEWHSLGSFPTEFHAVPRTENGVGKILDTPEFSVSATSTEHFVPTLALRFHSNVSGKSVAYSSDTDVSESVVALARGADLLIHEATTIDQPSKGHSSARQAGEQAQRAGVKNLVLVHLPPNGNIKEIHAAAAKAFDGKIFVGRDFASYKF